MSNISQVIEERSRNLGSFEVGRLLPFASKRSVGAFVFIDHFGETSLSVGENFDVPPHPHIGLSTLTYLFTGRIMHRDSLGNEVEIKPNEVNWMTAGKGIVHSERTPDYLRNEEKTLHGLQIWVAMPKELEQSEPSFSHIEADKLPIWEEDGTKFKLIAGEAFGRKSPVPVYSPLYLIEVENKKETILNLENKLYGETAVYILEGELSEGENIFPNKRILIAKDGKFCRFKLKAGSKIFIFGGEPFPEPRLLDWNFVATNKELIEAAKTKWRNQEFPSISGETEFVALP